MKKVSKEVLRYGAVATTLVAVGAAVTWSLVKYRKRERIDFAPRMKPVWQKYDGEPELPDTIASIDAAKPDQGVNRRAFAALTVSQGDLPLQGWQGQELVVLRQVGEQPWETAHTGHQMGELYPDPDMIGLMLPLGRASLRAFIALETDDGLSGVSTRLAETIPADFVNTHYAEVPAIRT
jgi:hypothetical protein